MKYGRKQLQKIEQDIDTDNNFKLAVEHVRALMFVERFVIEVNARTDELQQ